ncbi:hypothetical protein AOA61_00185, partial [Pseudomonas sp. 2995-1]
MEEDVGFNHFFYPGQLTRVNEDILSFEVNGNSNMDNYLPLTFLTDLMEGKIFAETSDGEPVQLKQY